MLAWFPLDLIIGSCYCNTYWVILWSSCFHAEIEKLAAPGSPVASALIKLTLQSQGHLHCQLRSPTKSMYYICYFFLVFKYFLWFVRRWNQIVYPFKGGLNHSGERLLIFELNTQTNTPHPPPSTLRSSFRSYINQVHGRAADREDKEDSPEPAHTSSRQRCSRLSCHYS